MTIPALYLDECIDRRLAVNLRASDLDVMTVGEAGTTSLADEAQLMLATSRGRLLISQNQIDFRRLHATWRREGRSHGGIILLPQTVPFWRLEQRVRLMLDWVSTFSEHSSKLYTWTDLQQQIIHGLRLPGWDEGVVREAIGWRP